MKLRNTEFGSVLGASGVQGFFGEGYEFHKYLHPFGLRFDDITFVAKTTTLNANQGNMPLRPDFTPQEFSPNCIKRKFFRGVGLNAIGLSGPGAEPLFKTEKWQARRKPFFLSFMSVQHHPKDRWYELRTFVDMLESYLPFFNTTVGLQLNFSCPNVNLDPTDLIAEINGALDYASRLRIPLVPKINLLVDAKAAKKIATHPACDALCVSNTIPWGKLPERIDWEGIFGSTTSPFALIGSGGLSGAPLLPLLIEWLIEAGRERIPKPINAGGGILSLEDAIRVRQAGAASIFLGSIAFLRPWRVAKIARRAADEHLFRRGIIHPACVTA